MVNAFALERIAVPVLSVDYTAVFVRGFCFACLPWKPEAIYPCDLPASVYAFGC